MTINQKNLIKIWLILFFAFLLGIFYFFTYQNQKSTSTNKIKILETFAHKLGFSFQYPTHLSVATVKDTGAIVIRSTEEKNLTEDFAFDSTILILENKNQLPLKEFVEEKEGIVNGVIPSTTEYSGIPFSRKIIAFQEKQISNHLAYFFHADPCSICRGETYRTYIELSKDKVINFDIFIDKETGDLKNYELYEQILTSFEFTER